MIFLHFMIGWNLAQIDQPGIDINYYARGYLMRLLVQNKGHCLSSRVMAQALINQPNPGQALIMGYEKFHINKPTNKTVKKNMILVMARNEADYNSFLSLNKLSPENHQRIRNAKDIKSKKMTVILSPGWSENTNALDLLHKLSCKKAKIIDAEEAGYQ